MRLRCFQCIVRPVVGRMHAQSSALIDSRNGDLNGFADCLRKEQPATCVVQWMGLLLAMVAAFAPQDIT